MTKLCLALEAFRRTDEGRIRDAKAFLTHFFPQDKNGAKDRIFLHMPNEVRADLLSNWGIRGKKSALRDDDDRVRNTVNDALNAGDIDSTVIEEGITPEILTDWVPLEDWWVFWRGTNLPIGSVRKALAVARDLSLFDERWFFEHLALKSQKLEGTDVVCAALSKEQIVAWMHAVHASGDASPYGLVTALGWETILGKTSHEGLLFALDALARQIGLAEHGPDDRKSDMPRAKSEPPPEAPTKPTSTLPEVVASPRAKSEPPAPETPRMEVPARVSARPPPEPPTPEQPPVVAAPEPPKPVEAPAKPAELPKPPSAKPPPPVPISTKNPEPAVSKPPPVPPKPPPVPAGASKAPPVPQKQPPPVPAGASKAPAPPPVPTAPPASSPASTSKPPARSVAPVSQDLPSVIIEEDPFFPAPPPVAPTSQVPAAPASTPPNARALFLGAVAEPPPMRPPAATIVGVAPQAVYGPGAAATDDVAMPTFTVPPTEPEWAPARAEPGDMGWDLVHGVTRPMGTHVQPKYNFEDDDEPTSEINLPSDVRRQ